MTAPAELSMSTKWGSVVAVWLIAAICACAVGVFSERAQYSDWLSISLAGSIFAAMCLQLATQEKRGFVNRLAGSVGGAVIVLGIAAAVLWG
jgi:ABC-type molybdate transport system substrate-binding protein